MRAPGLPTPGRFLALAGHRTDARPGSALVWPTSLRLAATQAILVYQAETPRQESSNEASKIEFCYPQSDARLKQTKVSFETSLLL